MNKFISLILLSFCITFVSNATLITNLSQFDLENKNYVNAEDQLTTDLAGVHYVSSNGWDYAWASPVNAESWGTNTLHAPLVQENWHYATLEQLVYIFEVLTLDAFTLKDDQGTITGYIHAVEYFNSVFTGLSQNILSQDTVTTTDFETGIIASDPNGVGLLPFYLDFADTFYVRESSLAPEPNQVPEPTTVLLLALGVLLVAGRKLKYSLNI
ncbi:PEP-CTERM sorting domain-containing protein [Thalassotalea sediminis]|uniref:PEP-CTERM sorting domain-containing protein n=1 Tax=Thalassotalea sediminis TaxID=1759089 RepID=UPI0025727283|nr:PEP-CTERM sorting domain-containing protein [Thalassotalea sediminis]